MLSLSDQIDFTLDPSGALAKRLLERGITTFSDAVEFVKTLPYKRVSNLEMPELVIEEMCGTCSSKHSFLALLAHESKQFDVQLKLITFELLKDDFPEYTEEFNALGADTLLEAHCLLDCKGEPVDATSNRFDVKTLYINKPILMERILSPNQSGSYKQNLHKKLFQKFCSEKGLDFEKLWELRFKIIKHLTKL